MNSDKPKAETIIRNANILTMDSRFSRAQALAISRGRILAVGTNEQIKAFGGTDIRVIDAHGKTVLPGLYDSHVHSYRASVSEFAGPLPILNSLAEAFDYIRQKAARQPPSTWIVLERVYPTRMKEGRLPTLAEFGRPGSEPSRSLELRPRLNGQFKGT